MINGNVITIDGLHLGINTPKMEKQAFNNDGEEIAVKGGALPPYAPTKIYSVDDFEGCPDIWMRGGAKQGSYFFPVDEGSGLWLDFTQNVGHVKHIAAVVSVQGVNARTGLPHDGIFLEQYNQECPTHHVPFEEDRYCPKCDYNWPPQNYFSTTVSDPFWIDGWRRPGDKEVRQFFMTVQEALGVAANIEKQRKDFKRTFNIGVAFFLSKEDRPRSVAAAAYGVGSGAAAAPATGVYYGSSFDPYYMKKSFVPQHVSTKGAKSVLRSYTTNSTLQVDEQDMSPWLETSFNGEVQSQMSVFLAQAEQKGSKTLSKGGRSGIIGNRLPGVVVSVLPDQNSLMPMSLERSPLQMEVGSGAIVRQGFQPDPNPLSFWQESPAAVFFLNYADREWVENTVRYMRKKRGTKRDGFLSDMPVGDIPATLTAQ